MSKILAWAVVLIIVWFSFEHPLQPSNWRKWRKARLEQRRAKEDDKRKRRGALFYWVEFVGSIVLFLFFFRAMVVEAYRIPTGSMISTLLIGDFLLVNKFTYGMKTPDWVGVPFTQFGVDVPFLQLPAIKDPTPGDVVVFKYPNDPAVNYIKRLVGGPGEIVTIDDKHVFLNGEEFQPYPGQQFTMRQVFPDSYSDGMIFPRGSNWNKDQYGPLTIPAEGMEIELNADSWRTYRRAIELDGHSLKARNGQFFLDDEPATHYTFEQDYYFMLGDNRDRSADSRYWGFLPRDLVVGKAWIIYFSIDVDRIKDEFWKTIRFGRLLQFID
jgi:signal peptidase I